MATKNPWMGIASYEEPHGNEADYLFCGRDEETLDVVRLIENNLFITLYGSSGVGKTSLLRAGVIPILKRKDYMPLYVRLSQETGDISYAEAIVRRIEAQGLAVERTAATKHINGKDRTYLWHYFATTRFCNENGREVYPVVILDQFEEIFRDADKEKAELLLQQIYLLLNDELEIPYGDDYNADTNYRFVASIREDFLFVLEDSIDELSLDIYKNNRYRLRAMKPANAKSAILVPGKGCIAEDQKDAVTERIIDLSKQGSKNEIDSILLSLVCAGTYNKVMAKGQDSLISADDLQMWRDNPMEVYYKDAVKNLSARQIRYIQHNLIRDDGSRKQTDAAEVRAAIETDTFELLTRGQNRMLTLSEQGTVELMHDKLALAVYNERKAFEERERKKRMRRIVILIAIVFLCILGLLLKNISQSNTISSKEQELLAANEELLKANEDINAQKNAAELSALQNAMLSDSMRVINENIRHSYDLIEAERNNALSANRRLLVSKARVVAKEALALVEKGDSYTARLLAEYAYTNLADIPEVENAMRTAWEEDNAILPGLGYCSVSNDGERMATIYDNNKIRIYDAANGRLLNEFDMSPFEIGDILYYSSDKKYIFGYIYGQYGHTNSYRKLFKIDAYSGEIIYITEDMNIFPIPRIAISPDNKYIACYNYNGKTLCMLDMLTGKKLYEKGLVKYYSDNFARVSFSSDGDRILLRVSRDFICMDVETGEILKKIEGERFSKDSPFSIDGQYVVSTSKDTIRIRNTSTGNVTHEFTVPNNIGLQSASFLYDNNNILVSAREGIYIYDISTNKEKSIEGYGDYIEISPNGKFIARRPSDYKYSVINICDAMTGKVFLQKNIEATSSPYFSNNGNRLIYTSNEGTHILDLNIAYGKLIEREGYAPITCRNDSKRILAVNGSKIGIFDMQKRKMIKVLKGHSKNVVSAAYSPDGKHIVSADTKEILVWDAATGKPICRIYSKADKVTYTPDGKHILCHFDNKIQIIDASNGNIQNFMRVSGDYMDISSNCNRVCCNDDVVRIYDIKNGNVIQEINEPASKAALNYNGQLVALANDNTISVWDLSTGRRLQKLNGHTAKINSIVFRPDGKFIVSASDDKTVRVWDVSTGNTVYEQKHFTGSVDNVMFTPDGKHLITESTGIAKIMSYGDMIEILSVWRKISDFHTMQELVDMTRSRFAGRKLTDEEKRKYYIE